MPCFEVFLNYETRCDYHSSHLIIMATNLKRAVEIAETEAIRLEYDIKFTRVTAIPLEFKNNVALIFDEKGSK